MISVSPSSLSSLRQYMATLKNWGTFSRERTAHVADWSVMLSRKARGDENNPSFITKPTKEGEKRRETTTNRPGLFKTEVAPWQPIAI